MIDAIAPDASVPDMLDSSDSGNDNQDDVTNVTQLAFQGIAEAGAIVRVFADDALVGQGVVGSDETDGVSSDQMGTWEVTNAQGNVAGTNRITSILGGCVLLEEWQSNGGPYSGKSLNIYDAANDKWQQTWVDNGGLLLELDGGLKDGKMVLKGHRPGENGAEVDRATCEPRGPGHDMLCGVWRDPDFDLERRAVYYARVVENPSCRYSAWQCLALPEAERPSGCSHELMQEIQQERAWTSPIWYTPGS